MGRGGEGRGGQLTVKSEKICREVEICRWGRGGEGRGSQFTVKTEIDPREGQLTINLGRMHEDFARINSDSIDWGGSINSQFWKDLQRVCKDYLIQS